MFNDLSLTKRLAFITSLAIDAITLVLILIVLILPLKTNSRLIRLTCLGTGAIACKISFYLLRELNRLEMVINGDIHLEENNFLNQITTLKTLNDQFHQNQIRPPVITQNYSQDEDQVEQQQIEEQFNQIVKPFDVTAFLEEVTGIAILGNSGSAKTCLVQYFAGILSPNQFLILDPHADINNPEYPWHGFNQIISDYDEILEYLEKLLTLLNHKDRQNLVIIADEYPAIRQYAKRQKSTVADEFILRYGSEARKFNKLPIFISQSGNTKALGLEGMGDFLENFGLIRLQKVAKKYLRNSPNIEVREACKLIPYPMLINEDDLYLHPTHGHYQKVAKHQPPINLKLIQCLPFTLTFNQPTVPTKNLHPHLHPHPPTATYIATDERDVGSYPQLAQYLDNLFEMDYEVPTQEENTCPHCGSDNIINWGKKSPRKKCNDCQKTFAC